MDTDSTGGNANQEQGTHQSGAEPVYGPAYGGAPSDQPRARPAEQPARVYVDGPSPPYTAPYPPYPSDVAMPAGISTPVASGLAYFTVVPAVFFLLLEPYRSNSVVRFHSWQSIFYFLAVAAIRVVELLIVSMLPAAVAYSTTGLLVIALFAAWLIMVIKAFQGSRWMLPVIGSYAAQTASTVSSR